MGRILENNTKNCKCDWLLRGPEKSVLPSRRCERVSFGGKNVEICLSISEPSECLTGVNMKRNQEAQRKGKRRHLKTNTTL